MADGFYPANPLMAQYIARIRAAEMADPLPAPRAPLRGGSSPLMDIGGHFRAGLERVLRGAEPMLSREQAARAGGLALEPPRTYPGRDIGPTPGDSYADALAAGMPLEPPLPVGPTPGEGFADALAAQALLASGDPALPMPPTARPSPGRMAMPAIVAPTGGRTGEGRPIVRNEDGSFSSERLITVTDPRINGGQPTNIPSMFGGKQVSDEEAIAIVAAAGGVDPETGRALPGFKSIDEAVAAAQQRSASIPTGDPLAEIAQGAAPPEVNGRRLAMPAAPGAAVPGAPPQPGAEMVGPGPGAPIVPAPGDSLAAAEPPDQQVAAQPLPAPAGTPGGTPAGRRQAVLNSLPAAPEAEIPEDSFGKMLLRLGLATAAAGARPGATLLSAAGAGGLEAMKAHDEGLTRRAQLKQQAFANQMSRESTAAQIAAADTKERQGDRHLDLEEKKILETAQTRLAEIQARSQDKALDREVQRQLGQERIELQRLIAAGQQGNQRALIELRETIARGERERKESKRIDDINRDAGELYERTLGRYRDPAGQISPENETKVNSIVAKAHPESRIGQSFIRSVSADAKAAIAEIEQSELPDAEKSKRIDAIKKRTRSLTGQGLD